MVKELASCKFIITDSGGINKTAPFFGKRALIMRDKIEWLKTEQKGYARKSSLDKKDLSWLMMGALPPSKRFYLGIDNSSEIILEFIKKALN